MKGTANDPQSNAQFMLASPDVSPDSGLGFRV